MAIPQGRLSTTPVLGEYLPPEGINQHPVTTFERGPVAIEDTSEGLLYQDWMLSWNPNTSEFLLTPDIGSPVTFLTIPDIKFASFTFDQSARVTLAYVTSVSSYLYWYDTQIAQTVTTDLGAVIISPTIYLDDKRATQNVVNDMMLWYTRADGLGGFNLYTKLQRDRFGVEYEMATGLAAFFIVALGMTDELRIQIRLSNKGLS